MNIEVINHKKELLHLYFLLRVGRLAKEKDGNGFPFFPEAVSYLESSQQSFKHPLSDLPKLNGEMRVFRDAFSAACQDARLLWRSWEIQLKKEVCLEIFPNWEEGSKQWGEKNFWEEDEEKK